MGTFSYNNAFDPDGDGDNLNGATQYGTTGTGLGVFDSPSSGDADNEFVFFSGQNEETRLDLNADLTGSEKVNSFSATMSLDFDSASGPFGDGEPDGISFSLGDPSSLQNDEEWGVTNGLAIRVIPLDWSGNGIEIK